MREPRQFCVTEMHKLCLRNNKSVKDIFHNIAVKQKVSSLNAFFSVRHGFESESVD